MATLARVPTPHQAFVARIFRAIQRVQDALRPLTGQLWPRTKRN